MATEEASTLYQRVVDDIREKIISGEYPVGSFIPSGKKLEKQYGMSQSSVQRGLGELKAAGILLGHGGKGVSVKAVPSAAADEEHDIEALRKRVTELEQSAEKDRDLEETVSRLESNLIGLYDITGNPYPEDETSTSQDRQEQRAMT